MISLIELLTEEEVIIYQGFIRVTYREDMNVMDVADIIRGIEGVTIVTSIGDNNTNNMVTYKIKIRSFDLGDKAAEDAFLEVRRQAIEHDGIERV